MLSWTKEHKKKAKDDALSLVKLQVQNRHCDQNKGNFEVAGHCSPERALLLWRIGCMNNDDPRLKDVKLALSGDLRAWAMRVVQDKGVDTDVREDLARFFKLLLPEDDEHYEAVLAAEEVLDDA